MEHVAIDGRHLVTGSEWEFEDALASHMSHSRPDILVYRRSGDPGTLLIDAKVRKEQERQWELLKTFWSLHFEAIFFDVFLLYLGPMLREHQSRDTPFGKAGEF